MLNTTVRTDATVASRLAFASGCRSVSSPGSTQSSVITPPPAATRAGPTQLSPAEAQLRDHVRANHEAHVALLERAVNIASGSPNPAGVRRVGELVGTQLAELGFTARMVDMPASMRRGGHIAERQPRWPEKRAAVLIHRLITGPR